MCVIEELIEKSFKNRTFQEKNEIIGKGRPQPILPNLSAAYKDKTRSCARYFTVSTYVKTPWLTGCQNLNKLFCWPCLLYSVEKTVWTSSGFNDLDNLCIAVEKHERTQNHIKCYFQLQTFDGSGGSIEFQKALETTKHNEQVKKNRYILSCFINAICFLTKQELYCHDHNGSKIPLSTQNFIELLNYTAQYDFQLEEYLTKSTLFKGTSLHITNEVISVINHILKDAIKDELKKTEFVSIVLDEQSNIASKSQISLCVRYVDNDGEIQERFLKFINVNSEDTANELFQFVNEAINEYGIANKIIGQSYNGAPVMLRGVRSLQVLVREKYPEALFFHCHSHILKEVLQQSLSNIKECENFFTTLSGIGTFFLQLPRRIDALGAFMIKRVPEFVPTTWHFSCDLLSTVKEHREHLFSYFENIVDNSKEWDCETVLQARGCVSFLHCLECSFLLEVFSTVFSHIDNLSDVLLNKMYDVTYCCKRIDDVKNAIDKCRDGFDKLWKKVSEISLEPPRKKRTKDPVTAYCSLFNEILDTLLQHMTERFKNYDRLEFISLLCTNLFSERKEKFPEGTFASLQETFGKYFDFARLQNELLVLYSTSEKELYNKPLSHIVKYFLKKKLNVAMPETYRLITLILTIPTIATSAKDSFSTSKRIQNYARSTQGKEMSTELSIMSIEKDLLEKIKTDPKYKFSETAVEKFCSVTRTMDFIFK